METLKGLDIVRNYVEVPEIVRAEEPESGFLGESLDIRFSPFGKWYEIDSWWEGRFLESTKRGAFKKTFAERGDQVKILYDHGYDPNIGNKVLGSIEELSEPKDSPRGLVNLFDTSYVRELLPGLRAGVYGSSFRFQVIKEEWNDEPGRSDHNPDGIPERTITEVRLFEFGPVTFPANPEATAKLRSGTDDYYAKIRSADPGRFSLIEARAKSTRPALADRAAHEDVTEPGNHSHGMNARERRERLYSFLGSGNDSVGKAPRGA